MKKTVYYHDFVDAFNRMGRSEQFSYSALKALFEYLEDIFDGDYELDVIALCKEWASYCDVVDINMDYGQDFEELEEAKDWLEDHTTVLDAGEGTLVILQF